MSSANIVEENRRWEFLRTETEPLKGRSSKVVFVFNTSADPQEQKATTRGECGVYLAIDPYHRTLTSLRANDPDRSALALERGRHINSHAK